MATSVVPAVLDAVVSLLTAELSDVTVSDGPLIDTPEGDFVTVGASPDDGSQVEAVQGWESNVGDYARAETFSVACYLDSFSGDTDAASVKTRRDGAYALLARVEDVLRSNPSLGGLLDTSPTGAQIASHALRQEQTETGFEVGIVFHIEVQNARI